MRKREVHIRHVDGVVLHMASMLVLRGSLSGYVEALFMPMEPSAVSVAMPRRPRCQLEPLDAQANSDAVLAKLNIPDTEKKILMQ